MPTVFCVYNLRGAVNPDDYDKFLTSTKHPGIRSQPWCEAFDTWRIDEVLGSAAAEPEGELPTTSPYTYVAKIEVSDMAEMGKTLESTEGQALVKAWSVYTDPTGFFTVGHAVP